MVDSRIGTDIDGGERAVETRSASDREIGPAVRQPEFAGPAPGGREVVMRRSGLLTAVFALAVGIVGIAVAFGASPGAAQPQPRAHVYLLRGLLKIFSLGMDSLAEELKGRDVDATVHGYSEWQTLADQAAADYKARKEAPIILIGHSLGADSVMEMAAYLGRKGVPVALVVQIVRSLQ